MAFAIVDGRRIEYRLLPGDPALPPLVFLHEGLGSAGLWRDFPLKLARRLGARALVYSRLGYGHSDGLPVKRTASFMHQEALEALPTLLAQLRIEAPLLIGHSDGASIALIHAALAPRPVTGLVLMAPHVFVEPVCLESIARIRELYDTTDLRKRLAKYHAHVDDAFLGWADTWLDPTFVSWSIEDLVAIVDAPMLLIQGKNDEYGTLAQLDRIEGHAAVMTTRLVLPDCGHSPHRDQERSVLEAIEKFASDLRRS